MLGAGLPMKVISERLRHAGIGITADLYTQPVEQLTRDAVAALAAALEAVRRKEPEQA